MAQGTRALVALALSIATVLMQMMKAFIVALVVAQEAAPEETKEEIKTDIIVEKEKWGSYNVGGEDAIAPCSNPQGFEVVMCASYMCNDCVSDWCVKSCQDVQKNYPMCRCPNWPESKKSYSGGMAEEAPPGKFL